MVGPLRSHPLTIRAALVLGFSLVLGLWLITGYFFTRQFGRIQTGDAVMNDRYLRAQDLLSEMRGQVLQATVDARNALIETDPAATAADRAHMQATIAAVHAALEDYPLTFETAGERQRLVALREELDSFQVRMLALVHPEVPREPHTVREVLTRDVSVPRDRMIGALDRMQAANRGEFVLAQQGAAVRYRDLQQQASRQLGLVLAVSGAIALLAIGYAGRLEGRLRRQQAKEARTAADLQLLSAKLISAQEDERRSIARELHDEIGQALMAVRVEMAYAQKAMATTGGPSQLLDDAQAITDGVLQSVRDLSQLLNPPMLEDLGLPAAVDWLIAGFGKRHPIQVDLETENMEQRLEADVEIAAYRILQEALTNVAKHSGAQTCSVRLRRTAHALSLTVEDDGHGFDRQALERSGARRGLGLVGIRERVARLDGRLTIESTPETGTRLHVELPA